MKRTREKKLDLLRWRLLDAIEGGRPDRVRWLLSLELDANALIGYDKLTPLMEAAHNGQADVAKVLLEHGADVHARSSFGETALNLASRSGRLVRVLLRAGADLEARVHNGGTPLSGAASTDDVRVLHALLEAGANIEPRNDSGSTPLLGAVLGGNIRAAMMLLEYGADLHARCEHHTALSLAALGGHTEMIRFLIERGLDVNEATPDGFTVLDSAQIGVHFRLDQAQKQAETNEARLMQILKQAGARESE